MNKILLWRLGIILFLLLWGNSFLYLRKVKEGKKIFFLNFILMLVFEFLLPAFFAKKFQFSIFYWMPVAPVIYGLVMSIFSMLIFYIKDEHEKTPFRFSLIGTGLAIILECWYMYFLLHP
jgi:hypothetical protein